MRRALRRRLKLAYHALMGHDLVLFQDNWKGSRVVNTRQRGVYRVIHR
jgi:hypothetical protein